MHLCFKPQSPQAYCSYKNIFLSLSQSLPPDLTPDNFRLYDTRLNSFLTRVTYLGYSWRMPSLSFLILLGKISSSFTCLGQSLNFLFLSSVNLWRSSIKVLGWLSVSCTCNKLYGLVKASNQKQLCGSQLTTEIFICSLDCDCFQTSLILGSSLCKYHVLIDTLQYFQSMM